jgi:hypothetical protein
LQNNKEEYRNNRRHNTPPEEIEIIRNVIISEAKKYLETHLTKKELGDKPRNSVRDLYLGSSGKKSGGWYDIDECMK